MKIFAISAAILLAATAALAQQRTVTVQGHTRSDGAYVASHQRTAPNSTQSDNWTTKGNTNPYTGKAGTRRDCTHGC